MYVSSRLAPKELRWRGMCVVILTFEQPKASRLQREYLSYEEEAGTINLELHLQTLIFSPHPSSIFLFFRNPQEHLQNNFKEYFCKNWEI